MKPIARYHHLELCLTVCMIHLLLIVFIYIENYVFYILPNPAEQAVSLFTLIDRFHSDNIILAVALGLLVVLLHFSRVTQWLSILIVFTCNGYLVINQVLYKLFFTDFHTNQFEGLAGASNLIDSFTSEIDNIFYLNSTILLISTVYIARLVLQNESLKKESCHLLTPLLKRPKRFSLTLAILLLASGGVVYSLDSPNANAQHHPIASLMIDVYQTSTHSNNTTATDKTKQPVAQPVADIYQPIYGKYYDKAVITDQLAQAVSQLKTELPTPNIVLFVLESVGSLQLLPNQGLPSPEITPTLFELSKNAIVFDTLYSVYPATTVSHVAMNTGGLTITQGSVFMELQYPYSGPTLGKALKALGYHTALLSSQHLDFGNLNGFYQNIGFDYYFDFKEAEQSFQKQNKLHSWGGEEQAVLKLALNWIDQQQSNQSPFFIQYLSNATHHPYTVPENYPTPFTGKDRKTRYLNALHYTDNVIATFIEALKKRNLFENTIILITGDHGQAFAERHPKNLTHKNYIYEENVKNFLLITHPKLTSSTLLSHRIGQIGDIMPTLLSFTKAPRIRIPGQSLLTEDYQQKLAYFFKSSQPPLWGVRDGQWKFIGSRIGNHMELYDLDNDPLEKNNIAPLHLDKTTRYDKLVTQWYIQLNEEFTAQLKNYQPIGGRQFHADEIRESGPKTLTFGKFVKNQKNKRFVKQTIVHPSQKLVIWTELTQYLEDKKITYQWTSPSGQQHTQPVSITAGVSATSVVSNLPKPMETGQWQLALIDQGKVLLTSHIQVDPSINVE